MIGARILADSISDHGTRLVTMEVTHPRFILAEMNTHRVFSRNSASSRAIPVAKQIEAVRENPFVPEAFPLNMSGMSATEYIHSYDGEDYDALRARWVKAAQQAADAAEEFAAAGVHKQITNRLLEPFMHHTAIISSTEWDNFFELRISPHAQPEMRQTAVAMKAAMDASTPELVKPGYWHMPLVSADDLTEVERNGRPTDLLRISAARCAAVTYNRHTERDLIKERERFVRLAENRHMSPFEHVATPSQWHGMTGGNFQGWRQLRWYIEREIPDVRWGT